MGDDPKQASAPKYPVLTRHGLDPHFLELATAAPEGELGRVVRVERGMDSVLTERGELRPARAHPIYRQAGFDTVPAVGDWVIVQEDRHGPAIATILARRTTVERKDPAERDVRQVMAANVDVVFLVHGADRPMNPRRLERALVMVHDGGAEPVIVLTKIDLDPIDDAAALVAGVAPDVVVHSVSAVTGAGLDRLSDHLVGHRTVVLLGESGSGKSSLVNTLAGEEIAKVGAVRASDAKGRHTTVTRELFALPAGGVVIDTPGLRSFALWTAEDGLEQVFTDIEDLAAMCRFSDCSHRAEPDCEVQAAVEDGRLARTRYDSFVRLQAEVAALRERQTTAGRSQRGRGGRRKRR